MNTYVALLRGVNVGGKNLIPMKALRFSLETNGFRNVSTYIQSGNIVLQSKQDPEAELGAIIESEFGFAPKILVLTRTEFEQTVRSNPFDNYEGKLVHFYYCQDEPKLDQSKLQKLISETESYKVAGQVFYLYAPDGIGRSKLVANIDTCLGVSVTGRNLNTVNKLLEMVRSLY